MSLSLLVIFDFIGTVAFAVSGAITGIQKRMDIFGVNILAILTACGGGLTRDIIMGNFPPQMFINPFYVLVAAVVANIVFGIMYFHKGIPQKFSGLYDRGLFIFDTVGLAAFMVDGVMIGANFGYEDDLFLLVFLGFITGVGGGVLRDVLSNQMPAIFVKHVYALPVIIGGILMVIMHELLGTWNLAMVLSFALVIVLRVMARHFLWNLPKVNL
ncbi:trimeric intracellular cation channel family protein [Butyrivibrio proteoclasticus]|uniref:trimeric intracellular cation channel family protein n=1 Tax=Butyrivibrio proteoclasticus TaxID=43305 RepID=UPI0003181C82|nr:trimeric intracellular cation channel family protein [Butyrivibrio proteoclasticus]